MRSMLLFESLYQNPRRWFDDMPAYYRQKGITLIIALVMLLIMTALGVTTMSGATLQERIASNNRQQYIARQNADAALKSAESYLNGLADGIGLLRQSTFEPLFLAATGDHLYTAQSISGEAADPVSSTITDLTNAALWTNANSNEVSGSSLSVSLGASNPRYVIEYLGCIQSCVTPGSGTDAHMYSFRITAIGYGRDVNAVSVLQAIYVSKKY